jgi:hypothetical protein
MSQVAERIDALVATRRGLVRAINSPPDDYAGATLTALNLLMKALEELWFELEDLTHTHTLGWDPQSYANECSAIGEKARTMAHYVNSIQAQGVDARVKRRSSPIDKIKRQRELTGPLEIEVANRAHDLIVDLSSVIKGSAPSRELPNHIRLRVTQPVSPPQSQHEAS